jgi:hypothetical protein
MTDPPKSGRRRLLALLTLLPALGRAARVAAAPAPATATVTPAAPFPESPKLLVAGPDDGALNRWADALQPALEQSLPPDTSMRRIEIGSVDGVTGANQFEARGAPDGMTILLVPGQAVMAWLVGDPRAQFDVGHWVPIMAGTTSAIVVGRPTALAPDGRARVAASSPGSLDLPALLGCQLLGARMEPVFGLTEAAATHAAFAAGAVDAVLLRGHGVPEQFAAFAASGAQALFTLGALDETGQAIRDPLFPDVPHFTELYAERSGGNPSGALYAAWCATAAATQLEFGLVLQHLTPPAIVALWRRAGMEAAGSQGVQATAAALNVRPLGGPAAPISAGAAAAHASDLLELRRWLASRFNWRPA